MNEQDKPGIVGNRQLRFDAKSGIFTLYSVAHAKVHCPMEFHMYPFDTQKCEFIMRPYIDARYQGRQYFDAF